MRRFAAKKAIMTGTAGYGNFMEEVPLPARLRALPVLLLIVLSTIVHTTPLFLIAFLKWLLPVEGWRLACARWCAWRKAGSASTAG
jgi:hypothetical protein